MQQHTEVVTRQREVTIKEFASEKRLSAKTVARMIKRGELKVARYSRRCVRIVLQEPVAA